MTALNCRVGDLAVVVKADLQLNVGVIVEIVRKRPETAIRVAGGGYQWMVKAVGGTAVLHYRFKDDGRTEVRSTGPIPDRCLRPLRPQPKALPDQRVASQSSGEPSSLSCSPMAEEGACELLRFEAAR